MFLAGIRPSSVHNSAVPCSRYVPENSFKERKIVAVFNSLLVHPQATAASIEAELNSLNTLQGIHFDAFAMANVGQDTGGFAGTGGSSLAGTGGHVGWGPTQ